MRKPFAIEKLREAFTRILDINRRYEKIGVTSNFVFGEDLPPDHVSSLSALTRNGVHLAGNKGALYLSPLVDERIQEKASRREVLRRFLKFKAESRLPAFLYLIQRL